jgi:hypothetical protein
MNVSGRRLKANLISVKRASCEGKFGLGFEMDQAERTAVKAVEGVRTFPRMRVKCQKEIKMTKTGTAFHIPFHNVSIV